jgi:hypothetical protein
LGCLDLQYLLEASKLEDPKISSAIVRCPIKACALVWGCSLVLDFASGEGILFFPSGPFDGWIEELRLGVLSGLCVGSAYDQSLPQALCYTQKRAGRGMTRLISSITHLSHSLQVVQTGGVHCRQVTALEGVHEDSVGLCGCVSGDTVGDLEVAISAVSLIPFLGRSRQIQGQGYESRLTRSPVERWTDIVRLVGS